VSEGCVAKTPPISTKMLFFVHLQEVLHLGGSSVEHVFLYKKHNYCTCRTTLSKPTFFHIGPSFSQTNQQWLSISKENLENGWTFGTFSTLPKNDPEHSGTPNPRIPNPEPQRERHRQTPGREGGRERQGDRERETEGERQRHEDTTQAEMSHTNRRLSLPRGPVQRPKGTPKPQTRPKTQKNPKNQKKTKKPKNHVPTQKCPGTSPKTFSTTGTRPGVQTESKHAMRHFWVKKPGFRPKKGPFLTLFWRPRVPRSTQKHKNSISCTDSRNHQIQWHPPWKESA
jgi:hypothetical protein